MRAYLHICSRGCSGSEGPARHVPVAIPSWHDSLSAAFDNVAPLAIPVVAIVTYGVVALQRSNRALAEARAEVARLSAESERSRIACDLHDLLGNSLTTITVKAGLARRVGVTDRERASREITEVEDLSRQALTEVRAAVSSYREATLASELARGRELLRASGVTADFPTATDVVDAAHQELFGWAVREGLTNVARHARATTCTGHADGVSGGDPRQRHRRSPVVRPRARRASRASLRSRRHRRGRTARPQGLLRVALVPGATAPS